MSSFRKPRPRPPVKMPGILPLVLIDFLVGGLQVAVGIGLAVAAPAIKTPAASAMQILGIVLLIFGLAMMTVGALLFTRQLWSYWLALVAHALLVALQAYSLIQMFIQATSTGNPTSIGCNIFMVVLYALAVSHAWKLIQAEKEKRASAGRLADDPEIDVAPGWDEEPR